MRAAVGSPHRCPRHPVTDPRVRGPAQLAERLPCLRTGRPLNPQAAELFPKRCVSRLIGAPSFAQPPKRTESHAKGDLRPGPAAQHDGAAASMKPSPAAISGRSPLRAQRRSSLGLQPPAAELLEHARQRGDGAHPRARRAVVVGVMKQDDVPGPGAGVDCARSRRASLARSSPAPTETKAPAASRGVGPRVGRRR